MNHPRPNLMIPYPITTLLFPRQVKEVQSVQDNTESLPNHLAEALTKDYSTMLDVVKKKDNFKRGA